MESPGHIPPDTAINPVNTWPLSKLLLRNPYNSKDSALAHTRPSRILDRAHSLSHKLVPTRIILHSQRFLLQRLMYHFMPVFPLGSGVQE